MPQPIPAVHSNGTGKNALMSQMNRVIEKLRNAQEEMSFATPHERDFYIKKDNDYRQAYAVHEIRMERIAALIAEFEELREAIFNQ